MLTHLFSYKSIIKMGARGRRQYLPVVTQSDWILPTIRPSSLKFHCPDIHTHTSCTQTDWLLKQKVCVAKKVYIPLAPTFQLYLRKCVFTKHTHRQPANRECCVTPTTCSLSLMLCHCFSPYTAISCRPGDSPLICSTTFNIQVAALSHFVSDLMTHMSGNYCSNLYTVNKVVVKV